MRKFKVVIGDWSGDGHNLTHETTVLIENDVSNEALALNYKNNVEKIGFDPVDYCRDYEDGKFPLAHYEKLISLGMVNDDEYFKDNNEPEDSDGIDVYVTVETYLTILMFFVGYGINNFSWREADPDIDFLFGDSRSICAGHRQAGYGLLSM